LGRGIRIYVAGRRGYTINRKYSIFMRPFQKKLITKLKLLSVPIPWNRVLLEKLKDAELVKKLTAFH
jgi:hypothetical protein